MTATDPNTDEKAAASAEPRKRVRSSIVFPYLDLDDAVAVAKGVHMAGGNSCTRDQLAAKLQTEMDSSTYRLKTNTARIFDLVTYSQDTITLTDLGVRVCDDMLSPGAKAEAFLAVELYKRVYEDYRGRALPPPAALESAIATMGVAAKQAANARQTFQRSAKQAGFFETDANRLVMPTARGRPGVEGDEHGSSSNGSGKHEESRGNGKRGGGDGGGGGESPEALMLNGLIKALPQPKADWPVEQRKKWLALAITIFDSVYEGGGAGDEVTVALLKSEDSAK